MSDPRNVAHDKKVHQEKEHEHAKAPGVNEPKASGGANIENSKAETGNDGQAPGESEKSIVVLSKLKEMEFHSRANIETLAQLMLTIDDELKQKEFSDPIGALYSAQDGFHTQIAVLIESYEAKCESLKKTD